MDGSEGKGAEGEEEKKVPVALLLLWLGPNTVLGLGRGGVEDLWGTDLQNRQEC